jgi:mxaA protein
MHYLLVLLWILSPHAQAGTVIKRMEVSNPRPFGHVIGDILQQKINLELATPYQLDEGSLPEAGPLSRWLEIRAPHVRTRNSRGVTSYEILLSYQTFYLAERLESIVIPSLELSVGNGERILPLLVPEWSFSVTPLAAHGIDASVTVSGLRPNLPPPTMPVTPHVYRIVGLSVCLLAALLYFAYAYWGIPVLARRNRPFAITFRHLRKLERKPVTDTRYLDALRSLHGAFNLTAGWTVLAGNLALFFVDHPEFASLRTPIETLFMQSRKAFFEPRQEPATDADSMQNLVRLCRRCRALERGIV